MLEDRALLAHARRDAEALDRALAALASIAPAHRFGATIPPDLVARSVEIGAGLRGQLAVVLDVQRDQSNAERVEVDVRIVGVRRKEGQRDACSSYVRRHRTSWGRRTARRTRFAPPKPLV